MQNKISSKQNQSPKSGNVRLCVISPLYHPSLGGIGRQAMLLTEKIKRKGCEIFVITRRMKGLPEAEYNKSIRIYHAWSTRPYKINPEDINILNILLSLTFSISCLFILLRERKNFDIVHFHGASVPLFINLLPLKMLRKKVIAKIGAANIGTEAGSLRGRYLFFGKILIKLLQNVDAFIATTDEIETGLLNDGFKQNKIHRITNFIDTSIFFPVNSAIKNSLKKKYNFQDYRIVTYSGRFVKRKGISYLLKAWKIVADEFENAILLLLGRGPDLPEMKSLGEKIGISDNLIFMGNVTQVTELLQATDIFVLPSLQEGMPNSLLEAMACMLPVVATGIGGVVDIIEDGKNGLIVNPQNVQELAEALKKLLGNKKLAQKISQKAYRTIEERFKLEFIAEKYNELYREIIKG